MKWKLLVAALLVLCGGCSSSDDVASSDFETAFPGVDLEQDVTYRYKFFIHCGMEWIHDLDGQAWRTDRPMYNGIGGAPDSLREFFVNPDERISPELWTLVTLVARDEIRLTLPDGSRESTYHPSDDELPGCA